MIAFSSSYAAIYAQKCLEQDFPVQVMPVLRQISSGCGIALRFPAEHLDAVRTALTGSGLAADEYTFYGISGSGPSLAAHKLGVGR